MTTARIYDAASTILQQRLSQVKGVGQVFVGGGSSPAVRVDINPTLLNDFGLSLEDVRAVLASANANRPKGSFSNASQYWQIAVTDQLMKAQEYAPLVVAFRNGAPVTLSDIATVTDSVSDIRNVGYANGKPAVLMYIFRQPGANITATVDRVLGVLPQLKASIPASIDLAVISDRTTTIRASVHDVQVTMAISTGLVIMVVFVFLRSVRTTLIPSIVVPVSLVSTFAVLYLCGYSVDDLSLMALTIATGFVVDDAIVVIENITRHLEQGMQPLQAGAARGPGNRLHRSVDQYLADRCFHSDSVDGGHRRTAVPRVCRGPVRGDPHFAADFIDHHADECARLLRAHDQERHGVLYRASESGFASILRG